MINIKEFFGLTYYISVLDQFLAHFDKKNPKLSKAQRQEKDKYARIYQLRDNPHQQEPKRSLWDKF